jgi:hypothetical protein
MGSLSPSPLVLLLDELDEELLVELLIEPLDEELLLVELLIEPLDEELLLVELLTEPLDEELLLVELLTEPLLELLELPLELELLELESSLASAKPGFPGLPFPPPPSPQASNKPLIRNPASNSRRCVSRILNLSRRGFTLLKPFFSNALSHPSPLSYKFNTNAADSQ